MKELKIENSELINKIRTDSFMNSVYHLAYRDGMSEKEMLIKAVVLLLDLKDQVLQDKIDEAMRNPNFSVVITKKGKIK